jgi:hypothetical protein
MRVVAAAGLALIIHASLPSGAAPPGPLDGWQAAAGAETRLRGGMFEASGAAHVPDAQGILFVDDDRTREVMWLPFGADGRAEPPQRVRLTSEVIDPEGMTFDGRYHYLVGSQSKRTGSRGDGLVRFLFNAQTRRAEQVESIGALRAFLGTHVAQLAGVERQTGDRSLNIEAIAWDPAGERWLLGLRAPLVNGRALVVPLALADRNAGFTAANLRVPGGRAIELPLDGAGIRSLEFDPGIGAFRLITGAAMNEERLAFRLFTWRGPRDSTPPALQKVFPAGAKPEGITRVHINGVSRTVVVYDGSGYLLLE